MALIGQASRSSTYWLPSNRLPKPWNRISNKDRSCSSTSTGSSACSDSAPVWASSPVLCTGSTGSPTASPTTSGKTLTLAEHFDLVWATGWEERANEHCPTPQAALQGPARASPSTAGRCSAPRTGRSTRSTSTPPTARPPGSTTTSTRPATPGPRADAPHAARRDEPLRGLTDEHVDQLRAGRTSSKAGSGRRPRTLAALRWTGRPIGSGARTAAPRSRRPRRHRSCRTATASRAPGPGARGTACAL